jgi:hypothetical protein
MLISRINIKKLKKYYFDIFFFLKIPNRFLIDIISSLILFYGRDYYFIKKYIINEDFDPTSV